MLMHWNPISIVIILLYIQLGTYTIMCAVQRPAIPNVWLINQ